MKLTEATSGLVEEGVLEWLQRWGWDRHSGTLHPNGMPSPVSVSVMSFSMAALAEVATIIPAQWLCPLFDVRGPFPASGAAEFYDAAPGVLLGPSAGWLAHHPETLQAWTDPQNTVCMWTTETDRQL